MPDAESSSRQDAQTPTVPAEIDALGDGFAKGSCLAWRKLRTRNFQDFLGYEGGRIVARVYQPSHSEEPWRWSLFGISRVMTGMTHGNEEAFTEARRKAEAGWRGVKGKWRDPQGRLIE
jgi:hypothetical protein